MVRDPPSQAIRGLVTRCGFAHHAGMRRPLTTRVRGSKPEPPVGDLSSDQREAVGAVAKAAAAARNPLGRSVLVVGLAGGSGAGKSWLADRLLEAFPGRSLRLRIDDFYRDLSHLPMGRRERVNFDRPQTIDWECFHQALEQLVSGGAADIPVYDFSTHTRRPERNPVRTKPLLLVEGLWPWWTPKLRRVFGLRVYVACPESLRRDRRLERDQTERGRTREAISSQLEKHVFPLHTRFVEPQRAWAHRVLRSPITAEDLAALTAHIGSLLEDFGKK